MNTRRMLESILFDALDKALDECVVLDGARRVHTVRPAQGPRILGRESQNAPQGKLLRPGSRDQSQEDVLMAA